ncbi:fungal-specific transcription factor domain-containing protein [Trichoderma velutinum]
MGTSKKADCCWTCKIRHVKCDATPAACVQCTSREINCHGYGPKPFWMDGSEEEERERQLIKRAVKKNFKQRKKLQHRLVKKQDHPQPRNQCPVPLRPLQDVQITTPQNAAALPVLTSHPLQNRIPSDRSFPEPLQYDEASLLMHYLDYVFPYQYPFSEKGNWSRGWLLWLLSKNGPLYRASMGLAALHQRSLQGGLKSHHLELEYHTTALRQLQEFIVSFNINELQPENENLVEVITCGVALISFEVLRGSTGNWQPHLCAMASIAIAIHKQYQLPQSSDQLLLPLFENKTTAAISFHIPVLLWMDILACVATQKKPRLPYVEWLDPNCNFELLRIMGCHNSVMKAIGNLGALYEWKVEAFDVDDLENEQLWRRIQRIEDELEDCMESIPITSSELLSRSNEGCATRIFAAAALVQLQVLGAQISPRPPSTKIRRAVSRTILEIQVTRGTISPRQITWPICVVGCVADTDQRLFFQHLLENVLSEGSIIFGNCGTVLDIMRNCWKFQVEQPDVQWDCSSAMKQMGIRALLI